MREFTFTETVLYHIEVSDEEISELRERLLWCGASDAEVIEESIARGFIELDDNDTYVMETTPVEEGF